MMMERKDKKAERGKPETADENRETADELSVIDGEVLDAEEEKVAAAETPRPDPENDGPAQLPGTRADGGNTASYLQYLVLPFLFLTVTLLGGLRIGQENGELIFFRPALICLIFGLMLLVLFFRAKLIELDGWLGETLPAVRNAANGLTLVTLFAASTQVFNALIPEQGLPFWVVSFCFFWTLWTNLFAEFDTRRLLQSLGGLFGLAFVAKYLVLINLVPENSEGWLDVLSLKNITQETFAYLLDLPDFSGATGYIQFFTLVLYLIGLFLLRPRTA